MNYIVLFCRVVYCVASIASSFIKGMGITSSRFYARGRPFAYTSINHIGYVRTKVRANVHRLTHTYDEDNSVTDFIHASLRSGLFTNLAHAHSFYLVRGVALSVRFYVLLYIASNYFSSCSWYSFEHSIFNYTS